MRSAEKETLKVFDALYFIHVLPCSAILVRYLASHDLRHMKLHLAHRPRWVIEHKAYFRRLGSRNFCCRPGAMCDAPWSHEVGLSG